MREVEYNPIEQIAREELLRAEQSRYAEIERETYEKDFQSVLSTEEGRRFIWRLLCDAGVFASTYDPKAMHPAEDMAFAEGRKQVGYQLLGEIQRLCPDKYFAMVKEQNQWQMNKTKLAKALR